MPSRRLLKPSAKGFFRKNTKIKARPAKFVVRHKRSSHFSLGIAPSPEAYAAAAKANTRSIDKAAAPVFFQDGFSILQSPPQNLARHLAGKTGDLALQLGTGRGK